MRLCLTLATAAWALLAAACIPPPLTTGTAADAGAGGGAGAGSGGATDDGGDDAGAGGAGGLAADASDGPPPVRRVFFLGADSDDALWIRGSDERLRYGASDLSIEIGNDDEAARAALRFQVDIPPRATIVGATLSLKRQRSADLTARPTATIQVYDVASVPAFSDDHFHVPEVHANLGTASYVRTFLIGAESCSNGSTCVSPDISPLVQQVVSRPDYQPGGYIGFVLSPDYLATGDWVSFEDYASNTRSSVLEVQFAPPAS